VTFDYDLQNDIVDYKDLFCYSYFISSPLLLHIPIAFLCYIMKRKAWFITPYMWYKFFSHKMFKVLALKWDSHATGSNSYKMERVFHLLKMKWMWKEAEIGFFSLIIGIGQEIFSLVFGWC